MMALNNYTYFKYLSFLFFSLQARQSRIKLQFETNNLPNLYDYYVNGDQHKLSQVIRNLISNALKFTPIGGQVTVVASSLSLPLPASTSIVSYLRTSYRRASLYRRHSTDSIIPESYQSALSHGKPVIQMLRIQVVDSGAGISPVIRS